MQSTFKNLRKSVVIAQSKWRQKKAIEAARERKREARDLGNVIAERDRFKQESARLKKELEKLKNFRAAHSDKLDEDEVERLRKEVELLRKELEKNRTSPASAFDSNCAAPSTRGGTIWTLGGVFGKKGDASSQASSGSFSAMPVVKRVLSIGDSRNGAFDSPRNLKKSPIGVIPTPPRSSPNVSLLDVEPDGVVEVTHTGLTANAHTFPGSVVAVSNPNDGLDHYNSPPVEERRGGDFLKELHNLHDAVISGDLRRVLKIVELSDEHHVLINEVGAGGRTALHAAVASSNIEIAQILIDHGAIVNSQDFDGETPLHLSKGTPMTTMLLEDGKANPNIPNVDGLCALHLAVQRRDAGSVRVLLQHGAKVDYADNIKWFTPLHFVALPERKDISDTFEKRMRARTVIASLLCNGSFSSNPDLNYQDRDGNSPLHYAVQIESIEACDVLNSFLDNGANPNLTNNRQQNPLLLLFLNDALRKEDAFQECLDSMLFHGANPNQQSMTGCTPLHLSLYHKDIDSAVQLVNRGAELHLIWKKVREILGSNFSSTCMQLTSEICCL